VEGEAPSETEKKPAKKAAKRRIKKEGEEGATGDEEKPKKRGRKKKTDENAEPDPDDVAANKATKKSALIIDGRANGEAYNFDCRETERVERSARAI